LANAIRCAPRGMGVGLRASSGTFGGGHPLAAGEAQMPGGYLVVFPTTRGLNQDGVILIEGNRFGEGGVAPDVRVPLDAEIFDALYLERRDVELEYAVNALTNAARPAVALRAEPEVQRARVGWWPEYVKT
jgi:hypothetical protein